MTVETQVHGKFKVFSGKVQDDKTLGPLADEVAAFASTVAAKSIGAEYLESTGRVILSLGYRDDEPAYPVTITCVSLGTVQDLETQDFSKIEAAITEASSRQAGIICHELYITGAREFLMVFMKRRD